MMFARTSTVVCALVFSWGVAAPALADVTVRQKNSGKGGIGGAMAGESVLQISGTKMRMDQTMGGDEMSTIIDVGAQKMTVLNHKKKEADVYDMSKVAQDIAKATGTGEITASITPTTRTRQIAGTTCTDHDVSMKVPMAMGNDTMNMVSTGVVCLAKGGAGAGDYEAFYTAVADKGLFFTDPRVAKAQPGQAKGMAALYRDMAARGVPYYNELQMKFEGSGMMAGMMNKMGGMTMTTEVTSITAGPLPAAQFEVPAGYKVRTR
jgi:hypothetical protein